MKTYTEWLSGHNMGQVEDDESETDLVGEQSAMMIQRFVGLLHGLDQREKTAIVERAIKDLRRLLV